VSVCPAKLLRICSVCSQQVSVENPLCNCSVWYRLSVASDADVVTLVNWRFLRDLDALTLERQRLLCNHIDPIGAETVSFP